MLDPLIQQCVEHSYMLETVICVKHSYRVYVGDSNMC
jgi:hypothetical protein